MGSRSVTELGTLHGNRVPGHKREPRRRRLFNDLPRGTGFAGRGLPRSREHAREFGGAVGEQPARVRDAVGEGHRPRGDAERAGEVIAQRGERRRVGAGDQRRRNARRAGARPRRRRTAPWPTALARRCALRRLSAQSAPASARSRPMRSAAAAPERNSPPTSCSAKPRPPVAPAPGREAARTPAASASAAKFADPVSNPATASAATPFCGPKIAVAPRSPQSGLLTSDMIVIESAEAAGVDGGDAREARGCRPDGCPVASNRRIPSAVSTAASSLGPPPPQPAATPGSKSARMSSPTPRVSRLRDGHPHRCRIGDRHDLRDLEHRDFSAEDAVAGLHRDATGAAHRQRSADGRRAARRGEDGVERPLAATAIGSGAGARRATPGEPPPPARRTAGVFERALERIGGEDDHGSAHRTAFAETLVAVVVAAGGGACEAIAHGEPRIVAWCGTRIS